jgi:hypothetical protein
MKEPLPRPIVLLDLFGDIFEYRHVPAQVETSRTPQRLPHRASHATYYGRPIYSVQRVMECGAVCQREKLAVFGLLNPKTFWDSQVQLSIMSYAEAILDMADALPMRIPWLWPTVTVDDMVDDIPSERATFFGINDRVRIREGMQDLLTALRSVGGRSLDITEIPSPPELLANFTPQSEAVRFLHNQDHWSDVQRGGYPTEKFNWPRMNWHEGTGWRPYAPLRVISAYMGYRSDRYQKQHDDKYFISVCGAGDALARRIASEQTNIRIKRIQR